MAFHNMLAMHIFIYSYIFKVHICYYVIYLCIIIYAIVAACMWHIISYTESIKLRMLITLGILG